MGDYSNRQREQYDGEAVLLDATANLTASANGNAVQVAENNELEAKVQVRGAVSGAAPTLDVTIEESEDGATGWTQIGAAPQLTAKGETTVMFRTSKGYVRAVATVGGTTPDFGDVEVFLVN